MLRIWIAAGAFLASCSHVDSDLARDAEIRRQVRERASFELNCPFERVTIAMIGDNHYGARGCNRRMKCRDVPFAGLVCDELPADGPPPASDASPPTSEGLPTVVEKPAPPVDSAPRRTPLKRPADAPQTGDQP
jgi:hypothetical protein